MRWDPRAWWRLWWAWVPVTVLVVANAAALVYLTSTTHGAEADLRERVSELEGEVRRLERDRTRARRELQEVQHLEERLAQLESQTFGTLEDRLVRVLRAVGDATRSAGLRPERFRYEARAAGKKIGLLRFGVAFSVEGTFDQIVRLLEALQQSDELLIVDQLRFAGEQEPRAATLGITVHVSTYVTGGTAEELERLLAQGVRGGVRGTR